MKRILSWQPLFVISLLLSLLVGLSLSTPHYSLAQHISSAPDEILVKFKQTAPEGEKENVRKLLKLSVKHKLAKIQVEVLKVPENTKDAVIKSLKANKFIEFAEPNYTATKTLLTNDASLAQQWGLFKINAANNTNPSAWDVTLGSSNVKVAVLDTGIETTHPDLTNKIIASANFTTSPTVNDMDGHGTHVAGIVAATTNNETGIAGTGYDTVVLNGKVLDDTGAGYYSWIANGIVWAADQGAQVISMSLSGPVSSQSLKTAIDYAVGKGVVVVAAAGNSGNSSPNYPAYYSNVIAVAATDSNDARASFSTYGSWVDVAAPGVGIYSTYKGNSYTSLSGTSMATPFVAGTAALIWAEGICTTNTCVRNQLEATADKITGTGSYWAAGRINAYNAVNTTPLPTPTLAPTNIPSQTPTPTVIPTPTTAKDTIKPFVSITSPVNGSLVPRRTLITVTADASDNVGVTKVRLYRNNNLICTKTTLPYSCSMNTASGTGVNVTYKAIAYDAANNSSTTTVTVKTQ